MLTVNVDTIRARGEIFKELVAQYIRLVTEKNKFAISWAFVTVFRNHPKTLTKEWASLLSALTLYNSYVLRSEINKEQHSFPVAQISDAEHLALGSLLLYLGEGTI